MNYLRVHAGARGAVAGPLELSNNVLKVELHSHTADDPHDRIPYSTTQLIDRAAALGYDALAITLHDRQLDSDPFGALRRRPRHHAHSRHRADDRRASTSCCSTSARGAEDVRTFDDLAALKQRSEQDSWSRRIRSFPAPRCLRGLMDDHADLFDAVECNAMFTASRELQPPARRWAAAPRQADGRQRRRPSAAATGHDLFAGRRGARCRRHLRGDPRRPRAGGGAPHSWRTAARLMADLIVVAERAARVGHWPRSFGGRRGS